MDTDYYTETVHQFVVEYLEDLPAEHRAQMRLNGMDPDDNWQLRWSFTTLKAAEAQCEEDKTWYENFCTSRGYPIRKTFRVRNLGTPIEIKRPILF